MAIQLRQLDYMSPKSIGIGCPRKQCPKHCELLCDDESFDLPGRESVR